MIGLSGLLTTSFDSMQETVRLLRAEGGPAAQAIPVIIGGGMLNDQVRRYVGADFWSTDPLAGVCLCQRLAQARRGT